MRIKSARPRPAPVTAELDPTELLHSEQLPVPSRTKPLQTPITGESEDQRLTASPELENDSTFQQIEDREEVFQKGSFLMYILTVAHALSTGHY